MTKQKSRCNHRRYASKRKEAEQLELARHLCDVIILTTMRTLYTHNHRVSLLYSESSILALS